VTQTGLQGLFKLADDEAIIITYGTGSAKYSGPCMQDWWFRTVEYWERQTSLTLGHSLPNADGTYTVVVSHVDPGVHNWVDTGGLHELLVVQRWQGLPKTSSGVGPTMQTRHVKVSALPGLLPAETVRVTPEQRKQQIERRRAAYARRLVDH
jgi:hypothetical protein